MPIKFTNHIPTINDELYNYLNDVNYGMYIKLSMNPLRNRVLWDYNK